MKRTAILPACIVLVASVAMQGRTLHVATAGAGPAASAGSDIPAASTGADSGAADSTRWDVAHPRGANLRDAGIDVRQGTWMQVDVSPDGRDLVFDLLGDIYLLPIEGGEARPLAAGIPWEWQPRFSPDGAWIAYTSDRGGGDNIWIMKRDGTGAKQVTRESFRLLNSPEWEPGGDFIVARKHFTSTRSLGAGEMWLYHRTGGEGLPMTKRPNEQKDAGEPAFSPDGRWLYYSQDATPGPRFEYNKDPNGQIYVIQRLDRVTGDTEAVVTGAGGAVRPTPSPDGKSLAFVRRIRAKSVLHVMDLASGAVRPIHDGLDKDQQETWAIHGVYPGMSWTPDSKSLVFWAGGSIRRIDVATREVREIPFHVRDTRSIAEAVRFPVDVLPPTFHTRMLRWVSVSPAGDRVAYQALGHIYVRDLPRGAPKRLTAQQDHFEYFPSWSRDGRWIVYTTWNDSTLGSIRVAPSRGGEGRVVTPHPGDYLEPAFTPDGSRIVYRAGRDGYLRSARWSAERGIFWIPAAGGAEPVRVTRKGFAPQFGASSDRVYLTDVGGDDGDDRTLFSVRLDGSDERTHLHGVYFTQVRLSPDERWVAFTERFNAYITPFVRTGRTVDVGPDTRAIPMKRVSSDAGDCLSWSGDGTKLHWVLGPQFYTRDIGESFSFVPGAPDSLPGPTTRWTDIGFVARADIPEGAVAFTGARIVTMNGDEVIEDGAIIVNENRILAVGPRSQLPMPRDVLQIDATGKTIIPGLVDVHWHGPIATEDVQPQENWGLWATLAYGVTTIHDPSHDTPSIFSSAELQRAGLITGPRIFSTGTILYGAKGDFHAGVDSLGDALFHVRRMKAVGAISVKSYNQPRRDQRQQVLEAARQLGILVMPEGGSLWAHNMTMVVDGHTGVEHSVPVAPLYDDCVQLWKQSGTGYTPTLVVGYGGIWGENYWYAHTDVWKDQRLARFVPRTVLDPRARRPFIAPIEEYGHIRNAETAKKLADAGVGVQLGAHGQREGLAAHWELWMFAQGGMTPLEAIRAGTIAGARYLGMERELGSLEPGKIADFMVLDANPLEDIRNSASIRWVVANGRVFDGITMDEGGNHPRVRKPFFWQREGEPAADPGAIAAAEAAWRCRD